MHMSLYVGFNFDADLLQKQFYSCTCACVLSKHVYRRKKSKKKKRTKKFIHRKREEESIKRNTQTKQKTAYEFTL
jgi:hypothetical protein